MTSGSLPTGTVRGVVHVPGSKSVAIRALTLAGMADGVSHLSGMPEGEDVRAMARVATGFGASVTEGPESWSVSGGSLTVPAAELDAGESGLTARIALAMAALVDGEVTVNARGRLTERPMGPLLAALRDLGVAVRRGTEHLPVSIFGGGGLRGGRVTVDTGTSTQFLTALLMVAPMSQSPLEVETEGPAGAAGYVGMTLDLMKRFGVVVETDGHVFRVPVSRYRPADLRIPPDASSAAYPMVAAAITGGEVEIAGLDPLDPQPDMALVGLLSQMGCTSRAGQSGLVLTGPESLQPIDADLSVAPDGALALAVACLFAEGTSTLTGLHTLRHKESDRLMALSEGLTRLGGRVWMSDDTLEVTPVGLRGARIRSHGDHRIAMALALAGLRLEGVEVEDPGVVAKTWPGYWDVMRSVVFSEVER